MTSSRTLITRLADGSRSVHPKGRYPAATVCMLVLLPLIPVLLAILDQRLGFRLLMLSLALYAITLAAAMIVWVGALRERVVRVSSSSPLKFVPSRGVDLVFWLVGVAGLLPAAAAVVVAAAALPTVEGGRLLAWGPYLLALGSLVGLVRQCLALRTPRGLTLDATGLHGVRGSSLVQVGWHELLDSDVAGPRGAKLTISARDRSPVVIDAHRLGSDPAAVVAVIRFFRDAPEQRQALADGVSAMQLVEHARQR